MVIGPDCRWSIYLISEEPVPSSSQNKRSFDSTKNQPKAQKAATQKVGKAAPGKPPIDNTEILTALADPLPISEQMTTLKRLILVGEENGNQILQFICNDVVNVLKSAFSTCDLFSFGSMTTGLAFKDSDLDVFAHLG